MPEEEDIDEDRMAFAAVRIALDPNMKNKNLRKQLAGKSLVYAKADATTRAGLDQSRMKEWQKWMEFFAARMVRGKEFKDLLDEGHSLIPTQWIEVDKADHKRRESV